MTVQVRAEISNDVKPLTVGIDASNIRVGGGVTHLIELLGAADPFKEGVGRVVVWSSERTLSRIPERQWLIKKHVPALDKHLAVRALWQRSALDVEATREACDILLIPGGLQSGNFVPSVAMSQNLLPFELRELSRYGVTLKTVKMLMLRKLQSATFRRAQGVIFLTDYAQRCVTRTTGPLRGEKAIIPLGINPAFRGDGRLAKTWPPGHEIRILYVSVVDAYKHQWHVARAVAELRRRGHPVALDLVGAGVKASLRRLTRTLEEVDPRREFIQYRGPLPYESLPNAYHSADIVVFASSCENLPNILIEGMAAGLPIACSDRGPMREVLRDGGVYFDPESPSSIASAIEQLIQSPEASARCAKRAYELSQGYSWSACADATFGFLAQLARKSRIKTVQ
jgi:glycosyltransferase involved in cell wall biosynthesis